MFMYMYMYNSTLFTNTRSEVLKSLSQSIMYFTLFSLQEFCSGEKQWPPLSSMKILVSDIGTVL